MSAASRSTAASLPMHSIDSEAARPVPNVNVRLFICGGGPAGTSLMFQAAKQGNLNKLLTQLSRESKTGKVSLKSDSKVAVIPSSEVEPSPAIAGPEHSDSAVRSISMVLCEGRSREFLGTGNLGSYQIRSNTPCHCFTRGILRSDMIAAAATLVLSSDDEDHNPVVLPAFASLEESKDATIMRKYGADLVPLPLVGDFMTQVGRIIEETVETHSDTSRVICNSKVRCLHINMDGTVDVTVETTPSVDESLVDAGDRIGLVPECKPNASLLLRRFRCESVVLALGGKQEVPEWVRESASAGALLMTSNSCLSRDGLGRLSSKLVADRPTERIAETDPAKRSGIRPPSVSARPPKRILIIGGSHSAFSCAWTILNFIAKQESPVEASLPSAEVKSHRVDFATDMASELVELSVGQVVIVHRSCIKLCYADRDEEQKTMTKYRLPVPPKGEKGEKLSSKGLVNSFTGLRGDAKALYLSIFSGKEKRVALQQCRDDKAMARLIADAGVVIWAGGYSANTVPIYSPAGNSLSLAVDGKGQVVVDQFTGLVMLRNGPLPNVYGIGLGYGLPAKRATLPEDKRERVHFNYPSTANVIRGDGVLIYRGTTSKLIMDHVWKTDKRISAWYDGLDPAAPSTTSPTRRSSPKVIVHSGGQAGDIIISSPSTMSQASRSSSPIKTTRSGKKRNSIPPSSTSPKVVTGVSRPVSLAAPTAKRDDRPRSTPTSMLLPELGLPLTRATTETDGALPSSTPKRAIASGGRKPVVGTPPSKPPSAKAMSKTLPIMPRSSSLAKPKDEDSRSHLAALSLSAGDMRDSLSGLAGLTIGSEAGLVKSVPLGSARHRPSTKIAATDAILTTARKSAWKS